MKNAKENGIWFYQLKHTKRLESDTSPTRILVCGATNVGSIKDPEGEVLN